MEVYEFIEIGNKIQEFLDTTDNKKIQKMFLKFNLDACRAKLVQVKCTC